MPEADLLTRIATNLRALRERRGWTRDQLAATAEVDPQMIKRIEHARGNPALVTLSRLAATLAISLSLLVAADVTADPAISTTTSEAEAFDSDSVGETISMMRRERQLSRRALARLVDVRTITLSRYESAHADARLLTVEPLARALGITIADFVRAIELRQQQNDRARGGWHERAAGVQCRLVTSTSRAQLWEWRLAPRTAYVEEPQAMIAEEIATAIRGEVTVAYGERVQQLRRGGSLPLTQESGERRFENNGTSTARLLRYQVTK